MAKYDESFKLKMVQKYLGGKISNRALAEQAGLHASLLRQWTNRPPSKDANIQTYSHRTRSNDRLANR